VSDRVERPGAYPRGYKGIYTPKLPKLDLTTDAEYVANLVKVQFITWVCYNCIMTFFLLMSYPTTS